MKILLFIILAVGLGFAVYNTIVAFNNMKASKEKKEDNNTIIKK